MYQAFEQAMEKHEGIVSKLEKGDIPLENEYYQKGIELSKLCSENLNHVQDKMVQIMNDQGGIRAL